MTTDLLSKMLGWLADGDTFIGIFENRAMDSYNMGRRLAFPFPLCQLELAEIGKTRAPDLQDDFGWKYILIHKTTDARDAAMWMDGVNPSERGRLIKEGGGHELAY